MDFLVSDEPNVPKYGAAVNLNMFRAVFTRVGVNLSMMGAGVNLSMIKNHIGVEEKRNT